MSEMQIVAFIPQSFVDWKGKVAAVIFTAGCTLRCGYCHNPELLENPPLLNTDDVLAKLGELAWSLDGLVITGGEPTLQEDLAEFCEKVHALGIKVKLDTNGTLPERFKKVLPHVDFVAMDVKAPFNDEEMSRVVHKHGIVDAMKESMSLIISSGVDHEFRTTWDPQLAPEDLLEIAKLVPTHWVIQEFRPNKCYDEKYLQKEATDYELLKSTAEKAQGPKSIAIRSEHNGEENITP